METLIRSVAAAYEFVFNIFSVLIDLALYGLRGKLASGAEALYDRARADTQRLQEEAIILLVASTLFCAVFVGGVDPIIRNLASFGGDGSNLTLVSAPIWFRSLVLFFCVDVAIRFTSARLVGSSVEDEARVRGVGRLVLAGTMTVLAAYVLLFIASLDILDRLLEAPPPEPVVAHGWDLVQLRALQFVAFVVVCAPAVFFVLTVSAWIDRYLTVSGKTAGAAERATIIVLLLAMFFGFAAGRLGYESTFRPEPPRMMPLYCQLDAEQGKIRVKVRFKNVEDVDYELEAPRLYLLGDGESVVSGAYASGDNWASAFGDDDGRLRLEPKQERVLSAEMPLSEIHGSANQTKFLACGLGSDSLPSTGLLGKPVSSPDLRLRWRRLTLSTAQSNVQETPAIANASPISRTQNSRPPAKAVNTGPATDTH